MPSHTDSTRKKSPRRGKLRKAMYGRLEDELNATQAKLLHQLKVIEDHRRVEKNYDIEEGLNEAWQEARCLYDQAYRNFQKHLSELSASLSNKGGEVNRGQQVEAKKQELEKRHTELQQRCRTVLAGCSPGIVRDPNELSELTGLQQLKALKSDCPLLLDAISRIESRGQSTFVNVPTDHVKEIVNNIKRAYTNKDRHEAFCRGEVTHLTSINSRLLFLGLPLISPASTLGNIIGSGECHDATNAEQRCAYIHLNRITNRMLELKQSDKIESLDYKRLKRVVEYIVENPERVNADAISTLVRVHRICAGHEQYSYAKSASDDPPYLEAIEHVDDGRDIDSHFVADFVKKEYGEEGGVTYAALSDGSFYSSDSQLESVSRVCDLLEYGTIKGDSEDLVDGINQDSVAGFKRVLASVGDYGALMKSTEVPGEIKRYVSADYTQLTKDVAVKNEQPATVAGARRKQVHRLNTRARPKEKSRATKNSNRQVVKKKHKFVAHGAMKIDVTELQEYAQQNMRECIRLLCDTNTALGYRFGEPDATGGHRSPEANYTDALILFRADEEKSGEEVSINGQRFDKGDFEKMCEMQIVYLQSNIGSIQASLRHDISRNSDGIRTGEELSQVFLGIAQGIDREMYLSGKLSSPDKQAFDLCWLEFAKKAEEYECHPNKSSVRPPVPPNFKAILEMKKRYKRFDIETGNIVDASTQSHSDAAEKRQPLTSQRRGSGGDSSDSGAHRPRLG